MQVKEIMTKDPQCCTLEMTLVQVAKMMKECDCGAIPVVNDQKNRKPIGIITDRDIVIRAVAEDKSPSQAKVKDCMSHDVVTITPDASLEEFTGSWRRNRCDAWWWSTGTGNAVE